MIEAMGCNRHGESQAGNGSFTERALHRLGEIVIVHRCQRLVNVFERVLEVFHDVGFRGERSRARFIPDIDRWLLFQQSGREFVIYSGDMLDLLRIRADSLELAIAGSEIKFILGIASAAGMNSCSILLIFPFRSSVTVCCAALAFGACAAATSVSNKLQAKTPSFLFMLPLVSPARRTEPSSIPLP